MLSDLSSLALSPETCDCASPPTRVPAIGVVGSNEPQPPIFTRQPSSAHFRNEALSRKGNSQQQEQLGASSGHDLQGSLSCTQRVPTNSSRTVSKQHTSSTFNSVCSSRDDLGSVVPQLPQKLAAMAGSSCSRWREPLEPAGLELLQTTALDSDVAPAARETRRHGLKASGSDPELSGSGAAAKAKPPGIVAMHVAGNMVAALSAPCSPAKPRCYAPLQVLRHGSSQTLFAPAPQPCSTAAQPQLQPAADLHEGCLRSKQVKLATMAADALSNTGATITTGPEVHAHAPAPKSPVSATGLAGKMLLAEAKYKDIRQRVGSVSSAASEDSAGPVCRPGSAAASCATEVCAPKGLRNENDRRTNNQEGVVSDSFKPWLRKVQVPQVQGEKMLCLKTSGSASSASLANSTRMHVLPHMTHSPSNPQATAASIAIGSSQGTSGPCSPGRASRPTALKQAGTLPLQGSRSCGKVVAQPSLLVDEEQRLPLKPAVSPSLSIKPAAAASSTMLPGFEVDGAKSPLSAASAAVGKRGWSARRL